MRKVKVLKTIKANHTIEMGKFESSSQVMAKKGDVLKCNVGKYSVEIIFKDGSACYEDLDVNGQLVKNKFFKLIK